MRGSLASGGVETYLFMDVPHPHGQLKALISGLASFVTRAILVNPQKELSFCRDPEDNMLLECCLESRANFLVTGDKDLLDLRDLPFDLRVLTPRQFLEIV